MSRERLIRRQDEAIVLRTWPFLEADLLVSLFTRQRGRVKGVARHALRSRRRFGGALEPMTHVRAVYLEQPTQELTRLDSFEIVSSPLSQPVDYARMAALELIAEVLEEALPDGAPDDAIFRLSIAVLKEVQIGRITLPVTYFCLWMCRLMGWMPQLGHCAVCGLCLRETQVWYSPVADGVSCGDDRRTGSKQLSPLSLNLARSIFAGAIAELEENASQGADLREFGVDLLERHLERRLRSAAALLRLPLA